MRLEDILSQALSDYGNFSLYAEGGTANIYLADWSPKGEFIEQRIIKVDKKPVSPRAIRHTEERGLDAISEIKASRHFKGERFLQSHDHKNLREFGYDGDALVMEYFPESMTIQDYVTQHGPLNKSQFREFMTQLCQGVKQISEAGWYHRDLSSANVMVDKDLNVKIGDLRNAARKEEATTKYLPTAGAAVITDPLIMSPFTKQEAQFNDTSELYSLGTIGIYALRGIYPTRYDPDTRIASSPHIDDLLTNGMLDNKKHQQAVEFVTKKAARGTKKTIDVLENFVTLEESERYETIESGIEALADTIAPTFIERAIRNWHVTLAVAAGLIGATSPLIIPNYIKEPQEFRRAWNSSNLTLSNEYVQMTPYAYIWPQSTEELRHSEYPVAKAVRARSGDEVLISVPIKYIAGREGEMGKEFPMKIYLEGQEAHNTIAKPSPFDENDQPLDGWMIAQMGAQAGFAQVSVPDLPSGTYHVAVELYAPKSESNIPYPNDGTWIARQRIPVVIGEEDARVRGLRFLGAADYSVQSISNPGREVLQDYDVSVKILETGFEVTQAREYLNNASTNLHPAEKSLIDEKNPVTLEVNIYNGTCAPTWIPVDLVRRVHKISPSASDGKLPKIFSQGIEVSSWEISTRGEEWSQNLQKQWENIKYSCK